MYYSLILALTFTLTVWKKVKFFSITLDYHRKYSSDLSSPNWTVIMAASVLWLTRVLATGLALILSYGWFEFQQLDKSSHCYSKADSSSRSWIWINTNSFFQLGTSCGWFYPPTNWGLYNWNNLWLSQALMAFFLSFFAFIYGHKFSTVCTNKCNANLHWLN